jgi:hypothetical protein
MIPGAKTKISMMDMAHSTQGSELAKSMKGIYFDLPDNSLEVLREACKHHTDGQPTSNMTIVTCWNADRLRLAENWNNTISGKNVHCSRKETCQNTLRIFVFFMIDHFSNHPIKESHHEPDED